MLGEFGAVPEQDFNRFGTHKVQAENTGGGIPGDRELIGKNKLNDDIAVHPWVEIYFADLADFNTADKYRIRRIQAIYVVINSDKYPFFIKDVFILEEAKAPDKHGCSQNKKKSDFEFFRKFQPDNL
jgi:hypothetical protein